ncbi:MAG: polyketide synthase dehydratase domain-containing protein [Rhodocyclales bacterium]|nr:polyketide synthase dehydratase domain-containing protein [Rhodocyclales bacterium]
MTYRVAIIGMACRFPQAADTDTFWANIKSGMDAVTPYPMTERWGRLDDYYVPGAAPSLEQTYCHRAGVVSGLRFDPVDHGVVPREVEEAEADQFVMLDLARTALADAGIARTGHEREPLSAGVMIGRTMPIGPVTMRFLDRVKLLPQLREQLRRSFPALDAAELDDFAERFLAERKAGFTNSRTRNLVPGFTASRISNRLNLCGPNYILDAACASSLIAIENAIAQLQAGRCKIMLAGGVHVPLTHGYWSMFTNIGALSHSEQIRPFDRDADGLLLGEGAGLIVLKPLDAALADHDRIHAVIEGTGSCSDGRAESLLAPSSAGQIKAFAQAWQASGIDPARARYIECHGTGMPRGDEVESRSLLDFFGAHAASRSIALGSVKSMIGHTLGAAGIASVIKTARALAEGIIPPSLHCRSPRAELGASGFYVPDKAEPWPGEGGRVAGVSAFGFGGINAHLVLSAPPPARSRARATAPAARRTKLPVTHADTEALVLQRPDAQALLATLTAGDLSPGAGPSRLIVFNPTPERLLKAQRIVARGHPWRGKQDIFFTPAGLLDAGAKLVFLFPGLGNQVNPDFRALARHFDVDLSHLDHTSDDALISTSLESVFSTHTLDHALGSLGIEPDAIAGHSLGEWTSCVSSGLIGEAALARLIGHLLELQGDVMGKNYHLLAVWCGVERLHALLAGIDELAVSVDNCPGHAVICASADSLELAQQRLRGAGILTARLGVEAASHTPFIRPTLERIRPLIDALALSPAQIPLWSSGLAAPFPTGEREIKNTIVDLMAQPVRFRELVDRLYREGFRAFVQIGNAGLSGFVSDTLKGRDFVVLDAASRERTTVQMLQRVAAGLYVEGRAVDLGAFGLGGLGTNDGGRPVVATPPTRVRSDMSLDANLTEPFALPALPAAVAPRRQASAPRTPDPDAMAPYWQDSLETFQRAQQQVMHAVQQRLARASAPPGKVADTARGGTDPDGVVFQRTLQIDHQRYPELFDHELYKSHDQRPISERTSIVPMTMMIELACETIAQYLPTHPIVAVRNVLSYRFIEILEPTRLEARVYRKGENLYAVVVEDRFSCRVEIAAEMPPAPARNHSAWHIGCDEPAPCPIALDRIYADRWLFHGPLYQGVRDLGKMDGSGAAGLVVHAGGKGSLLDSAFQVAGVWFCSYFLDDNVVLPVKIESIELHTDFATLARDPAPCECRVFCHRTTDTDFVYSLELARNDRILLRVNNFSGRRFAADPRFVGIFRRPEQLSLVSTALSDDIFVFDHVFQTNWPRVMLNKSYLTGEEIARVNAPRSLDRTNSIFRGIVAAKDAIKQWLFDHYSPPALLPAEITITHDEAGAPWGLSKLSTRPLAVSISHKPRIGVAIVGGEQRVGIDLEFIEKRGAAFEQLNYDAEEIAFFDAQPEDQRAFWQTLFWTAKEAGGKCTGLGLAGAPRRIKVREVRPAPGGWQGLVNGLCFTSLRYRDDIVISWVRGQYRVAEPDTARQGASGAPLDLQAASTQPQT